MAGALHGASQVGACAATGGLPVSVRTAMPQYGQNGLPTGTWSPQAGQVMIGSDIGHLRMLGQEYRHARYSPGSAILSLRRRRMGRISTD
jgi:hypothetical protein